MEKERGFVLVTAVWVVLLLSILAMTAMKTTSTELKITAVDRSLKEAFYTAEAGLEDARSRIENALSAAPIWDNQKTNPSWAAYVGSASRCASLGYDPANSNHVRYDPLHPPLDYAVRIQHKLSPSGQILKWGDSNSDGRLEENTAAGSIIYVVTAEGCSSLGPKKVIRAEFSKTPRVTTMAALYTKQTTRIQGTSVYITGIDQCGGINVTGVLTRANIIQPGNPTIEGNPPLIESSLLDIDVKAMVDRFKEYATHSYSGRDIRLQGVHWGVPAPGQTQQSPTSCSARNVVYFDTNSSFLKLTGGTTGCGFLLVDGDLDIEGGFSWYGVILITGAVKFTGGGEKNVTGAVLAGGTVSTDVVGGNANIIWCSQAIFSLTDELPLALLRWVEVF